MSWNKAIWIGGVARSGTSWIGQVFNSHEDIRFRFQPLFAYEFKSRVNEDSSNVDHMAFLNELWETESEFLTQSDKVKLGDYPEFKKSDDASVLAFKENRYQSVIEPMLRRVNEMYLVGVVRHPCAVINSWRKNEKEFPAGSVLRDEWRFGGCKNSGPEDYFGYYKWKEVANLYLDLESQYPDRAMVVQFEDLVRNRHEVTERMLAMVGLKLADQTNAFLTQSGGNHSDGYYAVYKNVEVTTKWKGDLDPYIVDEIYADLKGTRLERFLDEQ